MAKDMTRGSIAGTLVSFSVPLILSGLLQQLFNWVDAFIVGNAEGESALAAIGSSTSVYNLLIMIIVGFTSGLSVLSAQQYGMGEKARLHKTLSSFSVLLGGLFLILSVTGILFSPQILRFLDTPESIAKTANEYLRIMFIGVPLLAVYNSYTSVLRGLGDSRAPFLSILVSSIANAGLDILLVAVLPYGAAGAAAATVFAQAAMTVFIVIYTMKKYPYLKFSLKGGAVDRAVLSKGVRFGLPPAIQSGTGSLGNMLLQRFMNGFGPQTVAAITTAYRVDSMIILPLVNFGSGIATIVAQNIGAGNNARAKKTLKTGMLMMAGVSVFLTVTVLFFGEYLIGLFGLTQESVKIGGDFFRLIAIFYFVFGLATAIRGYLEGRGDMLFSGAAGIAALLVRIAASYLLADSLGNMVIAVAEAISWVMLLVVYGARAFVKMGKDKTGKNFK